MRLDGIFFYEEGFGVYGVIVLGGDSICYMDGFSFLCFSFNIK